MIFSGFISHPIDLKGSPTWNIIFWKYKKLRCFTYSVSSVEPCASLCLSSAHLQCLYNQQQLFEFWLRWRYALDKVYVTCNCRIKITTNNYCGFDFDCGRICFGKSTTESINTVTFCLIFFKICFVQNTSESLDTVQPHACLASPSGSNLLPWFNVHWRINPRSLNFLGVVFFINCGISEEKALFFQTGRVSLVKWVLLALPRIQGCFYSVMVLTFYYSLYIFS